MSFLLFLRGLIGVLIVFAIASYVITQSLWTTLLHTVICAVLIQMGYFAAVLFLVWRTGATARGVDGPAGMDGAAAAADSQANGEPANVPGVQRSRLP